MDILHSFGFMLGECVGWYIAGTILVFLALGYLGAPFILWSLAGAVALVGFDAHPVVIGVFLVIALIGNIPPLRTYVLSLPIMKLMQSLQLIPKISDTERVALEAGVVWVDAELFSGKPNFKKILDEPYPDLTPKEQEFIDKKIDQLCDIADDWAMWETREISPQVWDFIRKEKLFGMIIPEEYGGLGLSALAHSEVVSKISTRSIALGVLVMVPNSLGPAELLLHYGTEEQKKKLLPRLATAEEIPCFALTEPGAGSDAGSLTSSGTVFKGEDGELYIRLNWNKRWITLASISTILGLAFRLNDPENLLGRGTSDIGITCALIPTKTPGVVIGHRHDPLGVPFPNCPTQGKDVVVKLKDAVVGGLEGCGQGWTMLMDCLAAGRGISLPGQSAGGGKYAARVVSAHATNRQQFGVSIGVLEGVEEPIARIVGYSYLMEACRKFTAGALDKGIKPPVVTAIAKYYNTELMRKVMNDAMDVMGGAGISRGPRNVMAHGYIAAPIAITVEGANIMTRTLMIFGQGALRAHPFAYAEVAAVEKNDVKAFDKAFWGHMGHIVRNLFRSKILSWTRGYFVCTPGGPLRRYYQKLAWTSATFAIMTDIAMGSLGGALKLKGKLTGRYADVLGWMYMATSVMRRFEKEGRRKEDLPVVEYALSVAFHEIQKAFEGIFQNMTVPGMTWFFRGPLSWWVRFNTIGTGPHDGMSHKVSKLIQQDSEQRDRLTEGIYIPKKSEEAVARLDQTFKAVKSSEEIERKLRKAARSGKMPKAKGAKLIELGLEHKVITQEEYAKVKKAADMRWDSIQVDDFSEEEYVKHKGHIRT